ncbi:hypothetical protein, partial [Luteimonas sp. A482]
MHLGQACPGYGLGYSSANWARQFGCRRPNNSFKPNLLRYGKGMAEKACHTFASTTQVGLTQALGPMAISAAIVVLVLGGALPQSSAPVVPDNALSLAGVSL